MITVAETGNTYDLRGLSTDTKPTSVGNGSTFFCIDTGEVYMFNKATSTWVKIA